MSEQRKSIGLDSSESPFLKGARFIVIPADLQQDFKACTGVVDSLDGYGAWLAPERKFHVFPKHEEVFLIEFDQRDVVTHRTRILKRDETRVWVDAPSLTQREQSKLAPHTGRQDYRVAVDLPVQLNPGSPEAFRGSLMDLSRGGLSVLVTKRSVKIGERLKLQLMTWEHPVVIDTEVYRLQDEGERLRLALRFPQDMSVSQRELVSTFIIQVQRRDALKRSLPSESPES